MLGVDPVSPCFTPLNDKATLKPKRRGPEQSTIVDSRSVLVSDKKPQRTHTLTSRNLPAAS